MFAVPQLGVGNVVGVVAVRWQQARGTLFKNWQTVRHPALGVGKQDALCFRSWRRDCCVWSSCGLWSPELANVPAFLTSHPMVGDEMAACGHRAVYGHQNWQPVQWGNFWLATWGGEGRSGRPPRPQVPRVRAPGLVGTMLATSAVGSEGVTLGWRSPSFPSLE